MYKKAKSVKDKIYILIQFINIYSDTKHLHREYRYIFNQKKSKQKYN